MKYIIDAEVLLGWLQNRQKELEKDKEALGNLWWTGADCTYQLIIDNINEMIKNSVNITPN